MKVFVLLISLFFTQLAAADFFDVKSKQTQDFTVTNNGSQAVRAVGIIHESVSSDQCSPYFEQKERMLAPGETNTIHLETNCVYTPAHLSDIRLELPRSYTLASFSVLNPDMARKLIPGSVFTVVDYEGSKRASVTVVSEVPRHPTDHSSWSRPSTDKEGVAWLSSDIYPYGPDKINHMTLFISLPSEFKHSAIELSFSPQSGIDAKSFYFASFFEGLPRYLPVTSNSMTVKCDDQGCK